MLGSFQDAEDALQDTLLAAWQGFGGFQGRASLRTWLYRIATNRCLNARRSASRRLAKEVPEHRASAASLATRIASLREVGTSPTSHSGYASAPAAIPECDRPLAKTRAGQRGLIFHREQRATASVSRCSGQGDVQQHRRQRCIHEQRAGIQAG